MANMEPEPIAVTTRREVGAIDQIIAGMTTENVVGSSVVGLNRLFRDREQFPTDPEAVRAGTNYSVYDDLTEAEKLVASRFAGINSRAHLEARRGDILVEEATKRNLAEGPFKPWVVGLGSAILDPTTYAPVLGASARVGRGAQALNFGGQLAAQVTAQEALLHGSQITRTTEDTTASLVMAMALGGALGAVVGRSGKALAKPEVDAILEGARDDLKTLLRDTGLGDAPLPALRRDLLDTAAVGRVFDVPTAIEPFRLNRAPAIQWVDDTTLMAALREERPKLAGAIDSAVKEVDDATKALADHNTLSGFLAEVPKDATTELRLAKLDPASPEARMIRQSLAAETERARLVRNLEEATHRWEDAEKKLADEALTIRRHLDAVTEKLGSEGTLKAKAAFIDQMPTVKELAELDRATAPGPASDTLFGDAAYWRRGAKQGGAKAPDLPGLVHDPLAFLDGIAAKHVAEVKVLENRQKLGLPDKGPKAGPDTGAPPAAGGGPQSLSAAANTQWANDSKVYSMLVGHKYIRPYIMALKKLALSAPGVELGVSIFHEARVLGQKIASSGLVTNGHVVGLNEGRDLATNVKAWDTIKYAAIQMLESHHLEHQKAGGKLSRLEWAEEVSKATRRSDRHADPTIAQAAKDVRAGVYDALAKPAQELGLLPEKLTAQTAESYGHRDYNRGMIKSNRPEFEQILVDHFAEELATAKKAVVDKLPAKLDKLNDRLDKAVAKLAPDDTKGLTDLLAKHAADKELLLRRSGQLTDADAKRVADLAKLDPGRAKALEKSLREMAEGATWFEMNSLRQAAAETVDHIMGTPMGRVPTKFSPPSLRGALKDRTLQIPDYKIEQFLNNNLFDVIPKYVNTMAADIEFAKMFKDAKGFEEAVQSLRDEVRAVERMATTEKQRAKVVEEGRRTEQLIRDMTDRVRGISTIAHDPSMEPMARVAKGLRTVNFTRLLGASMISQIPDVGVMVMQEGFARTMGGLVEGLVSGLQSTKLGVKEAQRAGTAHEMHVANRISTSMDMADPYSGATKVERLLQAGGQWFGMLNLMTPWTVYAKGTTSNLAADRIVRSAVAVADGTEISAKEFRKMQQAGLSPADISAIAAQREHFTKERGVWSPNPSLWADPQAVEAFRKTLLHDVDMAVLTPGHADAPLWTGTEWGKTVFQFKRFAMASNQRILLAGAQGMALGDMQVLAGLTTMMAAGVMATALRDVFNKGQIDPKRDAGGWIREGIDKSGIASVFMELDNLSAKATGISPMLLATGGEPSRFAGQGVLERVGGPTAGFVSDLAGAVHGVLTKDLTESDLHKTRKLIPGNNMIWWKGAIDKLEGGIASEYGLARRDLR